METREDNDSFIPQKEKLQELLPTNHSEEAGELPTITSEIGAQLTWNMISARK